MAHKKPKFRFSGADLTIIEAALSDRVRYLEGLRDDPSLEPEMRPLCVMDLLGTQDLLDRVRSLYEEFGLLG